MAGRGTDIILGGNPLFIVKQKLSQLLLETGWTSDGLPAPIGYAQQDILSAEGEKFLVVLNSIKEEYGNLEELEKDIENLPYSLETSKEKFKNF